VLCQGRFYAASTVWGVCMSCALLTSWLVAHLAGWYCRTYGTRQWCCSVPSLHTSTTACLCHQHGVCQTNYLPTRSATTLASVSCSCVTRPARCDCRVSHSPHLAAHLVAACPPCNSILCQLNFTGSLPVLATHRIPPTLRIPHMCLAAATGPARRGRLVGDPPHLAAHAA
jgi:hypothetical protein